jgi:hypothetical protein
MSFIAAAFTATTAIHSIIRAQLDQLHTTQHEPYVSAQYRTVPNAPARPKNSRAVLQNGASRAEYCVR